MVGVIPPKNVERVFLHGSVLYTKPKAGDSPIAFVENEPVRGAFEPPLIHAIGKLTSAVVLGYCGCRAADQ